MAKNRRTGWIAAVALASMSCALASCSTDSAAERMPASAAASSAAAPAKAAIPALGAAAPVALPGLENVVTYDARLISGGVPEGDEGFDSLAAMGIKSIISVDGAEPDLVRAKAHGMRYVHLPIGYNGFDEARLLELTRATRDLAADGPVYMHCHHGKHRSAGASGAVAVSLGWMDNEKATALMKVSGTAPEFAGLYRCTAEARPLPAARIDAVSAKFPELTPPVGFVKGMLEIDEALDRLKAAEKAGWQPSPEKSPGKSPGRPSVVIAAEAGRLADALRLLIPSEHTKKAGADFAALLSAEQRRAQAFETLITSGERNPQTLSAAFKPIVGSCKDCHAKHRD
ncbi:MAG: hypothetical protein NTW19_24690 [Planctomycetota bacterium]|nr:hypothetical protein [Planctomycetota bacterium]